MRQILLNLVGNAVKFTKKGGVVLHVRGQSAGGLASIELTVEDTGIGIAPEDQSRVFGEFVRVDRSDSAGLEGTGLGLAITERLVGLMGGEIRVVSQPDIGSSFTVRLSLPL